MKCYGRFEDRYGLFSIVQYLRKEKYSESLQQSWGSDIVKHGLCTPKVFHITKGDLIEYKRNYIERVIFFFDLDSLSGNASSIMSVSEFEKSIDKSLNLLTAEDIDVKFCPVTLAAETIILQQYCIKGFAAERIICKEAPVRFQQKLASLLLIDKMPEGVNVSREVKNTFRYLNYEYLIGGLSQLKDTDFNYRLSRWLLEGCSFNDIQNLMSFEEVIEHIKNVNSYLESTDVSKGFRLNGRNILLLDRHSDECLVDISNVLKHTQKGID